MSRIFHRAAAIVAGLALPLTAFALVAPTNVDKDYVDEAYAAIVEDAVAQIAIATIEMPGPIEADVGLVRADPHDPFADEAVKPGFTTNGCCQWVYYNGRWYCLPCP